MDAADFPRAKLIRAANLPGASAGHKDVTTAQILQMNAGFSGWAVGFWIYFLTGFTGCKKLHFQPGPDHRPDQGRRPAVSPNFMAGS